jgi:flagellar biosynthesis protein FlhG
MSDQASRLREQLNAIQHKISSKAIAVVSGKGGVGKSNFSLNFAISLCKKGKKVLLIDLDIGMGNIDVLLGSMTNLSIIDIFDKKLTIRDIMNIGPENLQYISGGSGFSSIFSLNEEKLELFLSQLEEATEDFDFILFDMGAGVNDQTLKLLRAMHEIIVITTPEPTAITDGYAMIKHLIIDGNESEISLIVNRSSSKAEGVSVATRLKQVIKQFMNVDIHFLGLIADDPIVRKAVIAQSPFVLSSSTSQASKNIDDIARKYVNEQEVKEVSFSFIHRVKSLFLKR